MRKEVVGLPGPSSTADAATLKGAATKQVKQSARIFAAGDRVWIGISCHHYTVMSGPLPVVGKPGHFEHLVKPDEGEHQWTVEDRYLHRLPTNTPPAGDGAGNGTASARGPTGTDPGMHPSNQAKDEG